MERVYKVMGRQLKGGKWRYVAITDAGEVVIRKQATRHYANAYRYDRPVNSGTTGLGQYFTFGKAPSGYYKDALAQTYLIDFGEVDYA